MSDRYLGKFAGVVMDNNDPDGLCRIDVSVPSVLTGSTGWCIPALPYAAPGAGLAVVPPPSDWVPIALPVPSFSATCCTPWPSVP